MSGMIFRGVNGDTIVRTPLVSLRAAQQLSAIKSRELSRYVIQQGDTMPSIAGRFYGIQWRGMWEHIAAANAIISRDNPPVGLSIVIPDLGWRTL